MLGINRHGQRVIASNRNDEIKLRKQFWSLFTLHIVISVGMILLYGLFIVFFVNNNKIVFLILTLGGAVGSDFLRNSMPKF
jgi:quinol-cytochrome oxidoreductase complex cytochrome b subunit